MKNSKMVIRFLILIFLTSMVVHALINPGFTPINLVEQSALIQTIEFGTIGKDQKVVCKIIKTLKGKSKAKELTIDLNKASSPSQAKGMVGLIKESKKTLAAFLVGKFNDNDSGEEAPKAKAFLHVSGKWIILNENKGIWEPTVISTKMQGTWAGGTDMLIKAIDYILKDADPTMPVNVGVSWEDPVLVSTVKGVVSSVRPVDLDGKGKSHLFIMSTLGDKLFLHDGSKLVDVTFKRTLTSKSTIAAWLDLNGDGKLDLVSYDGKSYSFYSQKADGSFEKGNSSFLKILGGICQGIFAIDAGAKDKPGLLLATDKGVVSYKPGTFPLQGALLDGGGVDIKKFGNIGTCLVADLDGDHLADVLQLFENGSLLYKANKVGAFEKAIACSINLGKKISKATVGDFDGDGLLDVFTTAEDGNQIWHNRGNNIFEGTLHVSGEIEYIAKAEGVDAMVCDVNNDGKQDIMISYDGYSPQIFFNRGFRSFGHAHMLDLTEKSLLAESSNGQQTCCVADFNNDGAQDLIVVLKNGEVHFFMRESEEEDSLVIKVNLPVKGPALGPITVTGWVESGDDSELRCLGAWNVTPGSSKAYVGLPEAGSCIIKWCLPGGKMQSKEVEIEDAPINIFIK
ncbi:MAG: hypothetical protein COA79_16030 [Planctomycetota bacterium]|nr:MAG: hypothetical protein COA79_16030 [Planctomycetota bacterium]